MELFDGGEGTIFELLFVFFVVIAMYKKLFLT